MYPRCMYPRCMYPRCMYPRCMYLWCMYLWCMYLGCMMHISTMHIYMILDPDICVYDACIQDAYIHNAYLYDPWLWYMWLWCKYVWCIYPCSFTLIHTCMMHISMFLDPWLWCMCVWCTYLWSSILDSDACVYDAHINDPEACMYVWCMYVWCGNHHLCTMRGGGSPERDRGLEQAYYEVGLVARIHLKRFRNAFCGLFPSLKYCCNALKDLKWIYQNGWLFFNVIQNNSTFEPKIRILLKIYLWTILGHLHCQSQGNFIQHWQILLFSGQYFDTILVGKCWKSMIKFEGKIEWQAALASISK